MIINIKISLVRTTKVYYNIRGGDTHDKTMYTMW